MPFSPPLLGQIVIPDLSGGRATDSECRSAGAVVEGAAGCFCRDRDVPGCRN